MMLYRPFLGSFFGNRCRFESTRRGVRCPRGYVLGAMSVLTAIITASAARDGQCAKYIAHSSIQRRINLVAESDATSASAWHLTLDHHQL